MKRILYILLVAFALQASCFAGEQSPLIGEWIDQETQLGIKFNEDGTVETGPNYALKGIWTVANEDTLEITLKIPDGTRKIVAKYRFEDEMFILITPEGKVRRSVKVEDADNSADTNL